MWKPRKQKVVIVVCVVVGATAALVGSWEYHQSYLAWKDRRISEVCRNRIHDLWFALNKYSEANGGALPSSPGRGWAIQTSKYLKTPRMLKCPADKSGTITSYLLVPEAKNKQMWMMNEKVVLREDQHRHNGTAHALLGDGRTVELKGAHASVNRIRITPLTGEHIVRGGTR